MHCNRRGMTFLEASRLDTGLKLFSTESCDAAIVDYQLPDGTALELIPRLKAIDATIPVIVMTGHGTIDLAVKAIKLGAEQFITKPVELDVMYKLLSRALDDQRSRRRQLVSTRTQATIQTRSIPGEYCRNQEAGRMKSRESWYRTAQS